jgi:hypothetical protein
MKVLPSLLALLLLSVTQASAHYLWIDASADGLTAKVFFGEYQEDVREVKGGRLDEMAGLETFALAAGGERKLLTPTVNADHFLVASPTAAAGFVTQKLDCPVKDWSAWLAGTPIPTPDLALDVVPVDAGARTLKVLFNGQPLAKAKVNVHAPNLWSRELVTDENGTLAIPTPWPGFYVVEVIHLEPKPGSFLSVPYTAVRHRVTFALREK